MGRYDALPPRLIPRGLTREGAAAYVGLSAAAFDKARLEQKYPGPTSPWGSVRSDALGSGNKSSEWHTH